MTEEKKPNECDVCGNSDVETTVKSSKLGAGSFAYCDVCVAMEAEPSIEGITTDESCQYDPLGDKYYKDKKHVVIGFDKEKFDTRTDFLQYMMSKKK